MHEQLRYPPGDWDFIKSVPASGELEYSTICETLCDSTIVDGTCWSTFFVRAKTSQPTMFFDTPPDSGYSVDNLAPGVPQGLRNEGHQLAWTPNQEDDFSYYSVYASTDAEFDPMTDTLLGRTAESSFALEGVDPVFIHVRRRTSPGIRVAQRPWRRLRRPAMRNKCSGGISVGGRTPGATGHASATRSRETPRLKCPCTTRPAGSSRSSSTKRARLGGSRRPGTAGTCPAVALHPAFTLPSACAGRSGDEEDSPDPIAASEGARGRRMPAVWAPALHNGFRLRTALRRAMSPGRCPPHWARRECGSRGRHGTAGRTPRPSAARNRTPDACLSEIDVATTPSRNRSRHPVPTEILCVDNVVFHESLQRFYPN